MAGTGNLEGKRALITGASSGLGARFAMVLAQDGATVVAAARRTGRLHDLVERLQGDGRAAQAVEMDVTDATSVVRTVEDVAAGGGIDILVNNAGISIEKRISDFTVEDYDRLMTTNVRGAWLAAQAAGRAMIARGQGGKIVNVASALASTQINGLALYGMSKAAMVHMTRSMALEWARFDIQVNALAPGYIETEINAAHFASEAGQKQVARLLRKRIGTPDDLDGALRLLVSPDSNFITGAVLTVDDGQSLKGM